MPEESLESYLADDCKMLGLQYMYIKINVIYLCMINRYEWIIADVMLVIITFKQ